MITNIQCRPVPSIWTGAVIVPPTTGEIAGSDLGAIEGSDGGGGVEGSD